MDNGKLLKKVQGALDIIYTVLEANDAAIRFLSVTGIGGFHNLSCLSDRSIWIDISLNPDFGGIVGFTSKELFDFFDNYLDNAEKQTKNTKGALVRRLQENYAVYCFDEWAQQKVFDPWSVLNFLEKPELGFINYSAEAKNENSISRQFHKLANKKILFSEETTLQLSEFNNLTDIENIQEAVLLVQAGYLTIKRTECGTAFLGFPNRQVKAAIARGSFSK